MQRNVTAVTDGARRFGRCGGRPAAKENKSPQAGRSGPRSPVRLWAGVVTRTVGRIAVAIADELRIRRDMRELRAMDDHMLKDVGLTRADIRAAVLYGRD